MRVLMLSWEYPPRKVGGLATHVYELSKALAEKVEIHIVTCNFPGALELERVGGAVVHRINVYSAPSPDFLTWAMLMNASLLRAGCKLISEGRFDMIHCHDWLVAQAGVTMKHATGTPLVATIHSTESGRRNGIHTDYQRVINEIEGWLTYEASRIVCCSWSMVNEVAGLFNVPRDKIWMIPNGVDPGIYRPREIEQPLRAKYADPSEKIVLYVGRLVPEKGVNVLIGAIPRILSLAFFDTPSLSALSESSLFTAWAMASELLGGTFSPVTPSSTISDSPPVSEATTGAPEAMASRQTIPKGS